MFVVFDLETTGFRSMADDVIQFAYILYDSNNNFVRAESLYFYYEGMSWGQEAYEVHQIPQEFLKQYAGDFYANLLKMYSVLMYANVVGHNAMDFDCVFAENWLNRMGLPNLRFRCVQDTMTAFKSITHRSKIKLVKLAELLGIPDVAVESLTKKYFGDSARTVAHDAAFDTVRTALITLYGIKHHFISFGDEAPTGEPVDDVELELSDEPTVGRDPNGLLLRVRDSGGVRHVYVNTADGYNDGDVSNAELSELMSRGRLISQIFTKQADGDYIMEQDGAKLVYKEPRSVQLVMGNDSYDFLRYPMQAFVLASLQKSFKEDEE